MLRKVCSTVILTLSLLSFVLAQSSPPKPEILLPGEKLIYEVKYTRAIFRGLSIGTLTFSVDKDETGKSYKIKFEARSKGTLLRLFGQRIVQIFQSEIDAERFRILKTIKRDEQGDRIRDSEAVFDYIQKKVVFTEIDPKDPLKPPRKIASKIEEETHDLVSGVYRLRQNHFNVGKTFETVVSDSGLVYKIPVKVTGRELVDTIIGKVWCFKIEPEVFGPNRMIEQEGRMIIWIADNDRKIPVASRIYTKLGRLEVKLKQIETPNRADLSVRDKD